MGLFLFLFGFHLGAEIEESPELAHVVHAPRATAWEVEGGGYSVIPLSRSGPSFMAEFHLPRGAVLKKGESSSPQYLYIIEGSAVLVVAEETFFIGPRMGIYIPAGVHVEWINSGLPLFGVQFFPSGSPYIDSGLHQKREESWPRQRRRRSRIPTRVSTVVEGSDSDVAMGMSHLVEQR